MGIRLRLSLLFAAATALACAGGGFAFVRELSGSLRNSVQVSLQTRADALAQQVRQAREHTGSTVLPANPPGSSREADAVTQVLGAGQVVEDASGPGSARPLLTVAQFARALDHPLVFQARPDGPEPFLLLAEATGPTHVAVVGDSLATVDQALERATGYIVIGGVIGTLAAALAAWLIAGAALRPVERMRRQAAEASDRDTGAVLAVPSTNDEIAALARTINTLLSRLQRSLDRQRGFVSAAGHELRTPLSILRGELELAERPGRSTEELRLAVREAARQTDHLIRLSEDLLLLSRGDEGDPVVEQRVQDLIPLAEEIRDAFAARALEAGVTVRVEAPRRLEAAVDADRLRQMVGNLLDNALRFAPAGSAVVIRLSPGRDGDREAALVEVLDEGPGFPPDRLDQVFDRFSRADGSRNGSHDGAGLGLAIVRSLALAHGGRAEAANRNGHGARVVLTLPAGRG